MTDRANRLEALLLMTKLNPAARARTDDKRCPWCERKMDLIRRIACDFCGTELCFDCILIGDHGELFCESCGQELEKRRAARVLRGLDR